MELRWSGYERVSGYAWTTSGLEVKASSHPCVDCQGIRGDAVGGVDGEWIAESCLIEARFPSELRDGVFSFSQLYLRLTPLDICAQMSAFSLVLLCRAFVLLFHGSSERD